MTTETISIPTTTLTIKKTVFTEETLSWKNIFEIIVEDLLKLLKVKYSCTTIDDEGFEIVNMNWELSTIFKIAAVKTDDQQAVIILSNINTTTLGMMSGNVKSNCLLNKLICK